MSETPRREPTIQERLRDFLYHTVTYQTADRMALVRERYYQLAELLVTTLPDLRERSLALTHLEESAMRAIQCLATSEGTPVPIGESRNGNTTTLSV